MKNLISLAFITFYSPIFAYGECLNRHEPIITLTKRELGSWGIIAFGIILIFSFIGVKIVFHIKERKKRGNKG